MGEYEDRLKRLSFKQRVLVQIVVYGIKKRKILWTLNLAAWWIATHLEIDKKTKTWKLSSEPMGHPDNYKVYYDDIDNIIKSHPELYKEWRGPKAHTIIDTDPNATEFK